MGCVSSAMQDKVHEAVCGAFKQLSIKPLLILPLCIGIMLIWRVAISYIRTYFTNVEVTC
eukprot:3425603-Amphidinium_carterae.1